MEDNSFVLYIETADRNSFIKRSQMNVIDAKADVFWMAFKGLPKKERQSVVERLLTDTEFMDDLIDIATLELRCEETSRPLNEYLAKKAK